jgi:predicted component of type VI protein secretion system
MNMIPRRRADCGTDFRLRVRCFSAGCRSAAQHLQSIRCCTYAVYRLSRPEILPKESEDVAAIKDIGNYFDRAEYIKWKSFRDTTTLATSAWSCRAYWDVCHGPDTVPVRSFNYVEEVKGPDHDKYLWTNASFAFASNMVRSFINNGWCVQSVARRPVVRFRTCLSICTISVPAIR